MSISPSRLTVAFYGYSFGNDFVLLYPVYALLFTDTGLSVAQVSSLFVIWSITGIVLEVPSGALADALSRRLLLIVAPLLTATGYALWVLAPSYWAFAVGFVLWGAAGSLQSGAQEALVYEELEHVHATDSYARLIGRAKALGVAAVMLATAAAAPVFARGGYPAVATASVLACVVAALAATALPEHRNSVAPDEPELGYLATLRDGVSHSWRTPAVRAAVLLVPAVGAVYGALEEYTPLLARGTGVADSTVPLLVLLVEAGIAVGGLFAGVAARIPVRRFAVVLALAAVAMAVGAYGRAAAGIVLVAAAFGVFQLATVLADVRLQRTISGNHRATITSVASFGTDLVTIAVYGLYATASGYASHGTVFAWFALPYLVIAVIWVGSHNGRAASPDARPTSLSEVRL